MIGAELQSSKMEIKSQASRNQIDTYYYQENSDSLQSHRFSIQLFLQNSRNKQPQEDDIDQGDEGLQSGHAGDQGYGSNA